MGLLWSALTANLSPRVQGHIYTTIQTRILEEQQICYSIFKIHHIDKISLFPDKQPNFFYDAFLLAVVQRPYTDRQVSVESVGYEM